MLDKNVTFRELFIETVLSTNLIAKYVEVIYYMKLLALLVALVIWFVVLLFLRIRVNLDYSYKNLESKLFLRFKILFSALYIKLVIPREMFSLGIENILSNIIEDTVDKEIEVPKAETKKNRYMFLRHFTGEIFRKYISGWSKFLWLKNKLLKLKQMFYRKVEVYSINSKIEIGGRDAAETGILVGVIWAYLGKMTARICSSVSVKKNKINYYVQPRFDDEALICNLNCILSLKNSHIIFTGIKSLSIIIKIRRIGNNG